jgi:hypothetical protein
LLHQIEQDFRRLVETGYVKTSDATSAYNCVAFTLGDQNHPWWPPLHPGLQQADSCWPDNVPCQATVSAFVELYVRHGFEPCDARVPEEGCVKVAIYVEPREELVEHVALQLPNGRCLSKMGRHEDIAHTLEALEGPPHFYRVAQMVRCRIDKAPAALQEMIVRYF